MIGKTILFAAKIVLYLFLLLVVASILPIGVLFEMIFALAFGWFHFLRRVLPEVTLNPASIGMVVICSGLLLWGTQRFCSWLYLSIRSRQPAESVWPSTWPWRWSVGIYCGLWVLFLASMSVTGITHQIGWLVRSEKPIIENMRGLRERWELKRVADQLSASCQQAGWEAQTVRMVCEVAFEKYGARRVDSSAERFHVVFIVSKPGTTDAVFIAHRESELRDKYGYHRVTPNGVTEGPIERMSEDIRTFAVKAEGSDK